MRMRNHSRMPFFAYVVAIAGLLSLLSPIQARAAVLTHGPVVGGVTASTARIFVRTDAPGAVSIRYGTDPALATSAATAPAPTVAASDFTRIVDLTGLSPTTKYYLDISVD